MTLSYRKIIDLIAIICSLFALITGAISCTSSQSLNDKLDNPKKVGQILTLREVLVQHGNLPQVALSDAQTPMPSTATKDMLFVDGTYYWESSVTNYLKNRLVAGVPIVIFGEQSLFIHLCLSVNAPIGETVGGNEGFAHGIKLYPPSTGLAQDRPSATTINIMGSKENMASLIQPAMDWVYSLSQNTPEGME